MSTNVDPQNLFTFFENYVPPPVYTDEWGEEWSLEKFRMAAIVLGVDEKQKWRDFDRGGKREWLPTFGCERQDVSAVSILQCDPFASPIHDFTAPEPLHNIIKLDGSSEVNNSASTLTASTNSLDPELSWNNSPLKGRMTPTDSTHTSDISDKSFITPIRGSELFRRDLKDMKSQSIHLQTPPSIPLKGSTKKPSRLAGKFAFKGFSIDLWETDKLRPRSRLVSVILKGCGDEGSTAKEITEMLARSLGVEEERVEYYGRQVEMILQRRAAFEYRNGKWKLIKGIPLNNKKA